MLVIDVVGTAKEGTKNASVIVNNRNNEPVSQFCATSLSGKYIKGTDKYSSKKLSTTTGKISAGNVDKRVALTCAPKTSARDETLFINKVKYVLGPKLYDRNSVSWLTSSKFYGLLRNALGGSSGLIFPYTPSVSFSHTAEYDSTSIMHSNLTYQSYKYSPPPTIGVTGTFTADNRDNALHMLSAIWFCVACTKCDFGEKSNYPGLPPPILYLNGYDHLIDNIPVIIKSVNYKYPEDKHYVNLVLDMSKDYNKNEAFCQIYDSYSTYEETKEHTPGSFEYDRLNFVDIYTKSQPDPFDSYSKSVSIKEHKDGISMSFWLPTEMSLELQLVVQPNLLKTKKQWSLNGYKTGLLMTNNSKNPSSKVKTGKKNYIFTGAPLMESFVDSDGRFIDANNTCITALDVEDEYKQSNFIPSGWTW